MWRSLVGHDFCMADFFLIPTSAFLHLGRDHRLWAEGAA
ncbi:hypothetical protein RB8066 [Rhodopirellula baltica SH 1]|uniref:Uncharacterized protein n=1 Tax=Rhodopirellula baltica (strain DSM 10527 / NCIMB 13988 / SH1) TaxID=243090 RepID=Q7UG80_RHOBA|nr:hypothetical protein RB8066 [Rhodopirellula baltica SH 1]